MIVRVKSRSQQLLRLF